ncbi:hypothetical protein GCM10023219_16100 [Stakelama sediminis]|uniref:Putative aspartyl protease n=1 Tax=Stakelama sediminis TaxID=463200 RepID=A0A840YXT9_9SPHN|nr:aspartyl protease family protein [Stakelama sediminis]MBB5718340.1 putative aspartyl protease [Stakelama sediminis]
MTRLALLLAIAPLLSAAQNHQGPAPVAAPQSPQISRALWESIRPAPAPVPTLDPETARRLAFLTRYLRMTVPVYVAGSGPYGFVIDTGAERSVIATQLAERLSLSGRSSVLLRASTGVQRVPTYRVPSLRVTPFMERYNIAAPVLNSSDIGAWGLLGLDFLDGYAVSIDFEHHRMTVRPSSRRQMQTRREDGEIVVSAKRLRGRLILTDAYFGSRRIRLFLDTGSMVSIGNQALLNLIRDHRRQQREISMISVLGDSAKIRYAQVDRLRIGTMRFRDLPIGFGASPPFAAMGITDEPALLLGMDALRVFRRVDIDFANQQVRFLMPKPEHLIAERSSRIPES